MVLTAFPAIVRSFSLKVMDTSAGHDFTIDPDRGDELKRAVCADALEIVVTRRELLTRNVAIQRFTVLRLVDIAFHL